MSETRTVRLGDVCQVTMGQAPKGDTYNTAGKGYPLIAGAGDFDKQGGISVSKYTTAPTRLSEPDSIIMSIRASIGDTVWADKVYCLGRGVASLQPGPELDSRFLWYWLPTVKKLLLSKARGATFVQVNRKDVEDLPLELPPLEEQLRFAEQEHLKFLIKQKREHQQALYRELETSLFISIFGNPKSWPSNHEMTTIGDLAESTQYGTSSKADPAGEYPVLRMGNITDDGKLDLSDLKYMDLSPDEIEKYTVHKGDFLFNRTNSKEKVGKAAVVLTDQKLAYAGYLVRVRFKNPDHAHFVAAFLNSNYGKKLRQKLAKTAVNQANINATELANIPCINPKNTDVRKFIRILDKIIFLSNHKIVRNHHGK